MNQRKSYSLHQVYTLLIILMSLWYGALKGWGQSGRLFTSDSQLSSSLVNQVYQDRKGFIYIATRNGLDQYDGNEFQKFQKTGLPGAISSMHVNCVSEDSTGRLLVGLDKACRLMITLQDDFRPSLFSTTTTHYQAATFHLFYV